MFNPAVIFNAEVQKGKLDEKNGGHVVYWVEGTLANQNTLLKMLSEENTKQTAFLRAVWKLATNEDGDPIFQNKSWEEFKTTAKRQTMLRDYGSLILTGDNYTESGEIDNDMKETPAYKKEVSKHSKNSSQSEQAA